MGKAADSFVRTCMIQLLTHKRTEYRGLNL